MKGKLSLMWRAATALVLIASLGLAVAVPAVAGDGDVTVNIIECPTCPVPVSTNFGVKAEVTNTGGSEVGPVTVTCSVTGDAEVLAPTSIDIGTLDAGETDTVAFTLHCTNIGPATATITTNHGGSDSCNVDQVDPPALVAGVSGPCEVCTDCGENEFELDAWVQNTGDVPAANVRLVITRAPTAGAHIQGSTERWIGDLAAGEMLNIDTPWTAICDDDVDVTFTVTPSGDNACTGDAISDLTNGTWMVHQEDVLVDVICVMGLDSAGEPACGESCGEPNSHESDVISRLQQVAITASVTNCTNTPKDLDIQLARPSNTSLAVTTAHVVLAGYETDEPVTTPDWTVDVDDVCGCCEVLVTWVLECTGASTMEKVVVNVTEESTGSGTWDNTNCDSATITQVEKAHLTGQLLAYVADCTTGKLFLAATNSLNPAAVAVGQDFDVKIEVSNPSGAGGATAEGITVDLRVENQTDCVGTFYDIAFGNLGPNNGQGKWLSDIADMDGWCECLGEGTVNVTILDIDGNDANTCEPVLEDNIGVPCPLIINQCNFGIELMNPYPPDYVCVGDAFAVKAKLTNCGPCDFHDVDFTLNHSPSGRIALASEETNLKTITNVLANPCPGECNEYEVTWNVVCQSEGDVDIWVCAESTSTTTGDLHMMVKTDEATVHQMIPPDISIDIVSPDSMDTFVATGQEFAVTAVVTNNENANVTVSPYLSWMPEEGASFVGGPSNFVIGPNGEETVTWTLECEKEGGLVINAVAVGSTHECCPEDYAMSAPIVLWQYPTAHLDIDILGVEPGTTIPVGSDFVVTYKVVNTGQADATEVKAILSVDPAGSARPVAGIDSGYTLEIGTLTGHGQDGQGELGEYIGHWNLHCKEASESTIEITAEGFDEYGWHKKQQCQSTGNFIVEAGCFYIEELTDQEGSYSPERAWTYSLLIGEGSGFIGPFSINADVQGAGFGGGPDYLAHLDAMGLVVPGIDTEDIDWILDMMPGGCGDCNTLYDMLEYFEMQGLEKDALVYVGHLVAETDQDDILDGNYCVNAGYIQSINGNVTGSELVCEAEGEGYPEGVMSFLSGTYCSTMAKEALKAIPDEFIESASVTVKQVGNADLGVTKTANGTTFTVGNPVTFTVTVTNNGPVAATGVRVTDLLPAGLEYVSSTLTKGWYDATSGICHIGDLAVGAHATLTITAKVTKVGQMSNIAAVSYADQPDPTSSNNSDMKAVTGTPPPDDTTVELGAGWNLISLPLIPDDSDIDVVLADVQGNTSETYGIWAYDASIPDWFSSIPFDSSWAGDINDVVDGPGYWIYMDNPDSFIVDGYDVPTPDQGVPHTYNVYEGWNLIGFKSVTPRSAGDYLAAIQGSYTIIYRYVGGVYSIVRPGDSFMPGQGYWIAITAEEGTIYP